MRSTSAGAGTGDGEVALDQAGRGHVLRQAVGARQVVAVRVGCDHRDVVDIEIDELHAQQACCLVLDHGPRGEAAVCRTTGTCRSMPARLRLPRTRAGRPDARSATCRSGSGRRTGESVLSALRKPSEPSHDLAAGQGHEPQTLGDLVAVADDAVGSGDHERVIVLQRNEHGAVAAVGDLVEAVIEELAEDREQRVVRR